MTFMRVRSSRVSSAAACSKTLWDRTKTLGKMRESLSRRESMAQLSKEVASLATDRRKELLDEIFKQPGTFIIQVPPAESLALKSDLQLPWAKLREMRRCIWPMTLYIYLLHSHPEDG